ncbi:hypothetical protein JKA74_20625, partial [Marivirga sp. S37H4]
QFEAFDPATAACGSSYYTVDVTIDEPATVNITTAGANICQNQTISLSGDFSGSASSATWSEDGNGSLSNINISGNTVTADYIPVPADAGNTITFTLTTDNPANTCDQIAETVQFVIDEAPISAITTTATEVCEADPFTLQGTVSGGANNGEWQIKAGQGASVDASGSLTATTNNSGSWEAVFTPNGSYFGDVIFEFVASAPNSCSDHVEEHTLTIFERPTATLPANFNTCGDATLDLDASLTGSTLNGEWTIIANGDINQMSATSVTSGIATTRYNPLAADYNTTITFQFEAFDPATAACGSSYYTVDVTIDEPATVNITTAGANICQNQTISLSGDFSGSASSATWSEDGNGSLSNINVSGNTVTADYIPVPADAGNTVTFTLTTDNPANTCDQIAETVQFVIDEAPISAITTTATEVCEADPFTLQGTVSGGANNGEWQIKAGQGASVDASGSLTATTNNSGSWEAVFTPNGSYFGNVIFEFVASAPNSCSDNVEEHTLTIFERPTATLPANFNTCGDAAFDLDASLTGSTLNGEWTIIANGDAGQLTATN